ncbi:MAG: flagellar basal body P-ring formation chaperone FlgA [Marinobacterium sp.]|nr:flagellar basal body P-ring formation chaperone FlgA [Marinobacterium sp.]
MTIAKSAGCTLLPCLLLMPLYSVGQETTSTIEQQAATFLHSHYSERFPDAQIKVKITPVKARFQQSHCSVPIEFTPPRNLTSRPLTKASCIDSRHSTPSWTLFVRGQVTALHNALVLRGHLRKGQRLDSSLLESKLTDLLRHPDSVNAQESLRGMVSSRALPAGRILTRRDITLAPAINKGDAVIIEARRGGLSIRTTGIAQESGHIGKQIRAINNRSGKEIRGMIKAQGLIIVP